MHTLRYAVSSLSPLVISSRFGDMNMVTTEKYIPGRAVLGILAKQYVQKRHILDNAHEDELFYRWFLSGVLETGPAWIVTKRESGEHSNHFPVPFSVQALKNETDIIDLLHVDEHFDEQTEGIQGFCSLDGDTIRLARVETGLNFHHARDRRRGVSKEGIIFNYESILPGQRFEGVLAGPPEDLEQVLAICGNQWTAHLGRSRNAQYGKVDFQILSTSPQPFHVGVDHGNEISLTLLSDTIVLNENGFATTEISALEEYLAGARVKRAFSRQGRVEHFVGVWRLKQPCDTCFSAGSTFLLDVSACTRDDLESLQVHGVGERTHEGFGRCVIGLQSEERLRQEIPEPELPAPAVAIPSRTRDILIQLAQKAIKKVVQVDAMAEARDFIKSPLPSRSLCGRLESMAMSLGPEKFAREVTKLRATAQGQLKACYSKSGKYDLYDFLTRHEVKADDVLKQASNQRIADICKTTGMDLSGNTAFDGELYRLYFSAFFAGMRKAITKKGGSGNDR